MPQPTPPRSRPPKARPRLRGRIAAAARVTITGAEAPTAAEPARFSMVAYTGEPMRINSWSDPVVVDLETCDVSEQRIPALYDHWAHLGDVVGQVETLAVEGRQLVAAGRFTPLPAVDGRPSRADEVLGLARAGYQWQASVGADPSTVEEIKAGAVGVANWGREYPGPCVIGRGCRFRELSFVVLGGDRRTSVVTSRHRPHRSIKGSAVNPTYEAWLLSMGFEDAAALTPVQDANMRDLYAEEYPEAEAEGTPAETPASPAETVTAAVEDDEEEVTARGQRPPIRGGTPAPRRPAPQPNRRPDPVAADNRRIVANLRRVDTIQQIGAEFPRVTVAVGRQQVPLAAHAIASNWSADQTRLYALERDRPSHVHGRTGESDADRLRALVAQAAVSLTAGLRPDRIAASLRHPDPAQLLTDADRQRAMNMATAAEYRGYGIQALMSATITAAGRQYHGVRGNQAYVRAALEADADVTRMIRAGGQSFSTISLSGVLGNVANLSLIASYEGQATTWREIAAVRSWGNFKVQTAYRLDMTGAFKKVGPDGELKHVSMAETGYTAQLATYGAIIALTRQMQINDDLGAFLLIPQGLGRMAAIRVEEGVYVLILSNPGSFFHASNSNLLTGGGSALSMDGLTASETAFNNQVDRNGKPILTMPDRIILPTTLGVLGNKLFKDTTIVDDDGDANIVYANNEHAGKYRPVVSPYLNNTAIRDQDGVALTGQSSTAWYHAVNPAVRAGVVVGFLNGQETPVIEDGETDFATLGHQWRAYEDFGVGMEDPTAITKNTGA